MRQDEIKTKHYGMNSLSSRFPFLQEVDYVSFHVVVEKLTSMQGQIQGGQGVCPPLFGIILSSVLMLLTLDTPPPPHPPKN